MRYFRDLTLKIAVERYFANFRYITLFIRDNYNNSIPSYRSLAHDLVFSTFKCVVISSGIIIMYKFSKGRQHYLEYMKSIASGTIIGSAYSVYFNNEKLMKFVSQQAAIKEYIQQKKQVQV